MTVFEHHNYDFNDNESSGGGHDGYNVDNDNDGNDVVGGVMVAGGGDHLNPFLTKYIHLS